MSYKHSECAFVAPFLPENINLSSFSEHKGDITAFRYI